MPSSALIAYATVGLLFGLPPPAGPATLVSFARGLVLNRAAHAGELEASANELGYVPCAAQPARAPPALRGLVIDSSSLGFGRASAGPFEYDAPLVFESDAPLVRPRVCAAIRREAAAAMAAGARSTFTMTATNRDAPVHELPRTLRWLNAFLPAVIEPAARAAFGEQQ
jgi:hypothetical protein